MVKAKIAYILDLLFWDGTNWKPVETVVVVREHTVRIEAQAVRVVREVRTERWRPIEAAGTDEVGVAAAEADARGGQKYPVTRESCLLGLDYITRDSVDGCPSPGTVAGIF